MIANIVPMSYTILGSDFGLQYRRIPVWMPWSNTGEVVARLGTVAELAGSSGVSWHTAIGVRCATTAARS